MLEKIKDLYTESIQIQISAQTALPPMLAKAIDKMVACLLDNKKIIVCGEGHSYVNGQCLVANLLHRYELERPSLPSVLLNLDGISGTAFIRDNSTALFKRQFDAIAQSGDLLVALLPLGNEQNVLNIIQSALDIDLNVIVLTGAKHDHLQGILGENDLHIATPATKFSRILENHLFIINTLCEGIDHTLFSH